MFSLLDHVSKSLDKPKLGDPKHPTLWPSESSVALQNQYQEIEVQGTCRRSTYFRYLLSNISFGNIPILEPHIQSLVTDLKTLRQPTPRYLTWIGIMGELFEEYVIKQAQKTGVYVEDQVQVYIPEYNISGKIDVIIINPETGKYSIVEAKSIYGYNADTIIGMKSSMRTSKKDRIGQPRDKNLMQIALYQWWYGNPHNFEEARLIYGARDDGRIGEFLVRVVEEDNEWVIYYQQILPVTSSWIRADFTINDILNSVTYIQEHINTNQIPARDFNWYLSPNQIETMFIRDELTKTDREAYTKYKDRLAENEQLIAEGKKPKTELKALVKEDWHCSRCQWRDICYQSDGTERSLWLLNSTAMN